MPINNRLDSIETKLDGMQLDIDKMKVDMTTMKVDIDTMHLNNRREHRKHKSIYKELIIKLKRFGSRKILREWFPTIRETTV